MTEKDALFARNYSPFVFIMKFHLKQIIAIFVVFKAVRTWLLEKIPKKINNRLEKITVIRLIAVEETSVSRQSCVPNGGHLLKPPCITALSYWGFKVPQSVGQPM